MLYLRIRNVGHSPALDVKASFNPTFPIRGRDVSEYDVFRSIPVLGPGDSIMFFFGSGVDLLAEGSPSKSLRGSSELCGRCRSQFISEGESQIRFLTSTREILACFVPEAQHDRTLESGKWSGYEGKWRDNLALFHRSASLETAAFPHDVPDDNTEVSRTQ